MRDENIELDTLDNLEDLSMSEAFVCDFETGQCGPVSVDESMEEIKIEESQDENNNMV